MQDTSSDPESTADSSSRTIDDLDRALAERLGADGRASNRALAAALDVNEVTIAKRVRRLEEARLVRVVALCDVAAFGHDALAIVRVAVVDRPVAEVGEALARVPEVLVVAVCTGRYDLTLMLLARDLRQLGELLAGTIQATPGVVDVRCELALDVLKFESRWSRLDSEPGPAEPVAGGDRVDALDLAIIGRLQHDARASSRGVARELAVSENTVRARIKRMEDERLIRIQAVYDALAFGLEAYAFVGLHVDGHRIDEAAKALVVHPATAFAIRSLGDFDLLAAVAADSRATLLTTVLDELGAHPAVRRTETIELGQVLKHSYTWARLV